MFNVGSTTARLIFAADYSQLTGANRAMEGTERQARQTARAVDDHGRAWSSFGSQVRSAIGILAGVGIGALVREIYNINTEFERTRNILQYTTGSLEGAKREMEFIKAVSNDLGTSLSSNQQDYAKFAAATKLAGIELNETRAIFVAITEASRAFGLSSEQTQGALRALEQMVSKGKVSSEELRGQLGERLPGAFNLAAKAMGVTTQELDKMLQKGDVMAKDLLPRLARVMHDEFATTAAAAVGSASAQMQILQNRLTELMQDFSESGAMQAFADLLRDINDIMASPEFERGARTFFDTIEAGINYIRNNGDSILTFFADMATYIKNSADEAVRLYNLFQEINNAIPQIDFLKGLSADFKTAMGAIGVRQAPMVTEQMERDTQAALWEIQAQRESGGPLQIGISGGRPTRQRSAGMVDWGKPKGGGAAGGAGSAEETSKWVERLTGQYQRLTDSISPVVKAENDLAQAESLLSYAVAAGIETSEGKEQIMQRLTSRLVEQLAPYDTMIQKIDEEQALLKMSDDEREIQAELIQRVTALRRAGHPVTDADIAKLKEELKTTQDLNKQRRDEESFLADQQAAFQEIREQQVREAQRAAEETMAPYLEAATSIRDAFSDALFDAFREGEFNAKSFAESIKNIFFRMLADIASRAIFTPMLQGLFGTGQQLISQAPGFLGPMAGGWGSGGGVTLVGATGMGGGPMGTMLSGGGGFGGGLFGGGGGAGGLGGMLGSWGAPGGLWAGGSATAGGPLGGIMGSGIGISGVLGAAGMGAGIGSMFQGVFGRQGSGGMIGGALGGLGGMALGAALGSTVPIIGTAIGAVAGGLLGSLFGPKKSVGPNAGANVFFGPGGIAMGSAGADNKGDVGAAIEFARQAQEAFGALQQQYGVSFTRDTQAQFGSMKGQLFSSVGGGYERAVYKGGDSGQAIFSVLQSMLASGTLTAPGTSGRILQGGRFANIQELEEGLEFGKLFDQLTKTTEEVTGLAAVVADLNEKFADGSEKAAKYGLSVEEIEAGRARALAKLREDFDETIQMEILAIEDPIAAALKQWEEERKQAERDWMAVGGNLNEIYRLFELRRQQIVQETNDVILTSMKQTKDALRELLEELERGPLSTLSPGEQYDAARASFLNAAAMGRSQGQLPTNFGELMSEFLESSRLMFASTERYAEDYAQARNLLTDLLGLPRRQLGGFTAGLTWVGEQGPELIRAPAGSRVFSRHDRAPANDRSDPHVVVTLQRGFEALTNEVRGSREEQRRTARRLDQFASGLPLAGRRTQV
jgi:tape measure domain-containing protein